MYWRLLRCHIDMLLLPMSGGGGRGSDVRLIQLLFFSIIIIIIAFLVHYFASSSSTCCYFAFAFHYTIFAAIGAYSTLLMRRCLAAQEVSICVYWHSGTNGAKRNSNFVVCCVKKNSVNVPRRWSSRHGV